MGLTLIPTEKLKGRSGHAGNGDHYGKYRIAAANILPFIFEQLGTEKQISIKNADIAAELGAGFANKSPTSIYWALKYVLFHEGIWVGTATHADESEVLTFRKVIKGDQLPDSLRKKEYKPEKVQEPGDILESGSESESETKDE